MIERLPTVDYLFLQFRSPTPKLEDIAKVYYSHLSKCKLLEKARNQEFPFTCFRLGTSQKSPYLVDIYELAKILDETYLSAYQDFIKLH